MAAYYNEIDEQCCAWLRELMKKGLIADGDVDNRSIADVRPEDVRGYTQCHFFAGIGVWSHALRLAGWPDDRPVWTGSCPCQPFSLAGKRRGTADERHLWPEFYRLISACLPPTVFGEQVASRDVIGPKAKRPRVSEAISTTLSIEGSHSTRKKEGHQKRYRVRPGEIPAGDTGNNRRGNLPVDGTPVQPGGREDLGQPVYRSDRHDAGLHIQEYQAGLPRRQQRDRRLGRGRSPCDSLRDGRTTEERLERALREIRDESHGQAQWPWLDTVRFDLEQRGYILGACDVPAAGLGAPHIRQRLYWGARRLAYPHCREPQQPAWEGAGPSETKGGRPHREPSRSGAAGRLGDSSSPGSRRDARAVPGAQAEGPRERGQPGGIADEPVIASTVDWSSCDWIPCSDGVSRPVEPGVEPLAHGASNRVVKLRGYGNAIVAPQAALFIEAFDEACQGQ